jgi:hypothetical protein
MRYATRSDATCPSSVIFSFWLKRTLTEVDDTISTVCTRSRLSRAARGSPDRNVLASTNQSAIYLPHRAFVALAAICERFFDVSAAARATRPFRPPRRPRATAAGFFSFGASVFGASPTDSKKIRWANSFGSRGREVFDMTSPLSQFSGSGQAS